MLQAWMQGGNRRSSKDGVEGVVKLLASKGRVGGERGTLNF